MYRISLAMLRLCERYGEMSAVEPRRVWPPLLAVLREGDVVDDAIEEDALGSVVRSYDCGVGTAGEAAGESCTVAADILGGARADQSGLSVGAG